MSSPLILREGGGARLVEMPDRVAEALAAAKVLEVARTGRPGWWEVAPATRVGVVSAGGFQVVIQPKIGIGRLVFLMGYALKPGFWRPDSVHLDDAAELPEALAQAFVRMAQRALEQGLLKGYQTIDDSLPVLRGRIREADQLRRRWGRNLPLEVRYDEYTVDIAENQLLLAAAQRLLHVPRVGRSHRAGLQRLRVQLADVTAPVRGDLLPQWHPSRLNTRYQPALELADLILAGRSFEQRVGGVLLSGYLINMAKIFEDFVTVALCEALKPRGGRSALQYLDSLDVDASVPIQPDFVWQQEGRVRIVADAKYKAERPSGFPQADLYQMLAYCTALDLPVGHLVYAKGNEEARRYVVRHAGIQIIAHTLDLDLAPAELLEAVKRLAGGLLPAAREHQPTPG
ncbi:McrC family protein [Enemella sp. A6]|uniref:McrC family protein n=1 Tax=Enemella sp. A6 TaxID=3440152 RepID=UPI003EBFE47D